MYGAIIITEYETMPIWEYEKPLKEKLIALKVITGYQWDNEHKFLFFNGQLYAFSLCRSQANPSSPAQKEHAKEFNIGWHQEDHVYSLTLWDVTGNQTIYSNEWYHPNYDQPIPRKIIQEMESAVANYETNKIRCSDCGAETNADTRRRYFAGTYCEKCWEGKWKEIEAKETYD